MFELMKKEPTRLNVFDYEIKNPDVCHQVNDLDIDLLIVVFSTSSSYERRYAIRRTYGNLIDINKYMDVSLSKLNVRFLFMIDFDERRLKSILFEQNLFHDIVQINIPQGKLSETYRDFALFDWTSKYCPQARFIFKTDDSIFINTFLLLKFINQNENDRFNFEQKKPLNIRQCLNLNIHIPFIHGFIRSNELLSSYEKFIFLQNQISCQTYPNYLDYNLYLISNDARDLLICTFYRQSNELFFQSNIYITGILSEYLNIQRHTLFDYQINFQEQSSCDYFFSRTDISRAFACVHSSEKPDNLVNFYSIYWQFIINFQLNLK